MTPDLPLVTVPTTAPATSGININNNLQVIDNNVNNSVINVVWQEALQASLTNTAEVVSAPEPTVPTQGLPEVSGQCIAVPGKPLPEFALPQTGLSQLSKPSEETLDPESDEDPAVRIAPLEPPSSPALFSITALQEKLKELPDAFAKTLAPNDNRTLPAASPPPVMAPVQVDTPKPPDPATIALTPVLPTPVTGSGNEDLLQRLTGPGPVSASSLDTPAKQTVDSVTGMNTVDEVPVKIPGLQPARTEMTTPTSAPDTSAVATPRWQHALGERVIWQIRNEITTARIRLDPPDLGPLQVNVRLHNDHASVQFITQSADVKDAIASSLAVLRDQFVQSGIRMGDVSVDWQAGQQGDQQSFQAQGGQGNSRPEDSLLHEELPTLRLSSHTGLIDCYA